MNTLGVPSRAATGVRAFVLIALGVFFSAALVRNWSDNAYLLLPLAGMALGALSLPFIVATLLPRGAARAFVALIGVTLVYAIGGLCCLLFALALIPAATHYRTNAVFFSHLIALLLLLPVVVGINWRLKA